jgi:PKD domain
MYIGVVLLAILSILSSHYDKNTFRLPSVHAQETETLSPPPPSTQGIGVKITSPSTGSSISIGGKQGPQLEISGTSTDNSNTDCQVSVIVNGIKPYQLVSANGIGGINDFSSWSFLLNSSYASIDEGPNNKITSKIVCPPNLTKWYSVNVTGILSNTPILNITSPSSFKQVSNTTILNITSPSSFEQLSAGKMTVLGTSIDDFYKDCEVYVRKNNGPFEKATAAGLTGIRDYSLWKFTSGDNSSLITPGNTNTITAKLSCNDKIDQDDETVIASLNIGTKGTYDDAVYATINVVGINEAPIAEANADAEETRENEEVTLNGEESTDPNGDPLTFVWKQTGGERVAILEGDKALANFKVPASLREDTTFEFLLTVIDKYGEIDTDTISIEAIANSEPVADAGSKKEAAAGEQVTMDGTDSHDPDPTGQIISYKWEQSDGPPVSLQGSNQPTASFSVPSVEEDSTFEFTLTVTDNENAQDSDSVEVEVEAPLPPEQPDEPGGIGIGSIDNNINGLEEEGEPEFD